MELLSRARLLEPAMRGKKRRHLKLSHSFAQQPFRTRSRLYWLYACTRAPHKLYLFSTACKLPTRCRTTAPLSLEGTH